jgi:uncharacterized protein (DUF302 family)
MAHKAISMEPQIGLLIPCNVCVWDNEDGSSTVAAVSVKALFQLVDNPGVAEIACTVDAKLNRVIDAVGKKGSQKMSPIL